MAHRHTHTSIMLYKKIKKENNINNIDIPSPRAFNVTLFTN